MFPFGLFFILDLFSNLLMLFLLSWIAERTLFPVGCVALAFYNIIENYLFLTILTAFWSFDVLVLLIFVWTKVQICKTKRKKQQKNDMTVFHLISAAASKHTFRSTGVVSKSVPPSIFVFPYLSINLTLAVSQKSNLGVCGQKPKFQGDRENDNCSRKCIEMFNSRNIHGKKEEFNC